MSKTFSLREIADACSALSNQVLAGIPLAEATERLASIQRKYAPFWLEAGRNAGRGQPLSSALGEAWPETYVASIKVGEESGRVGEVCSDIEQSIEVQNTAFGVLGKLIYPVAIIIAGLVVSIFFLAFVIPQLMKAIDGGERSPSVVLQIGLRMNDFIMENGLLTAGLTAGLVGGLTVWVASGAAGRHFYEIILRAPFLREQVSMIFFAIWARVLALMTTSGLPIMTALPLSIQVLPAPLQPAIRRIKHALDQNVPLSKAVQPDMKGDDRELIPFYISNAFRIAEQTGTLDMELGRAAPIMVKDASRVIERIANIASAIAMAIAGALLVIPLGSYYTELFKTIQRIM